LGQRKLGAILGLGSQRNLGAYYVVVYAYIVHMRLIPSLKGVFNYNVASIFGFTAVLMTYFGVNYYLTGLHSYGKAWFMESIRHCLLFFFCWSD
jgi:hypothetical protein